MAYVRAETPCMAIAIRYSYSEAATFIIFLSAHFRISWSLRFINLVR